MKIKLLIIVIVFSSYASLKGQTFRDNFISPNDNAVDVSGFLNSTTGFLPIPIVITEPAVGFGGGLAIAYFHKDKKDKKQKGISPTVSMVAAAATDNGTWIAVLAHQGSYKGDKIRYLGFVGYLAPNLTFYAGVGDLFEGKFDFEMKGFATMHEVLFRVDKKLPFFAGLNYTFFASNIKFDTGINIPEYPGLSTLETDTKLGGVNASFLWDGRNNSFTPTKGIISALEFGRFATFFGGDTNYWNFSSRTYGYTPVVKDKLFSGYRLKLESKSEEAPFFAKPFVDLRGIPAMRYQDSNVITVETEWRWNFYKRWSAVGFIGAGEAVDEFSDLGNNIKTAAGGGFRYLLAEAYGLHVGIDVAKGPEIWTWNITVGSNWFR